MGKFNRMWRSKPEDREWEEGMHLCSMWSSGAQPYGNYT